MDEGSLQFDSDIGPVFDDSFDDVGDASCEELPEWEDVEIQEAVSESTTVEDYIEETRIEVKASVKLPWCVAQAINHDFYGNKEGTEDQYYALRRCILFFLGNHEGELLALWEIADAVGGGVDAKMVLNALNRSLIPLTSIPEYRDAYGFKIVKGSKKGGAPGTRWENREVTAYGLSLVNDGDVPVRVKARLCQRPRLKLTADMSERDKKRAMSKAARDTGIGVMDEIPENAEMLILRSSSILRKERGYMDIAFALFEALRVDEKCSMWPFKIKFDFGKESLGAKLEEWTIKFASELGFVIYGVGGGYYSIFFLDEGERDAVLERKYSDGKEDIYYHDVIPFEHKRFKNRLRYRLMKWHRMVPLNSEGKKGWPSWLPSKLYYDLVSAIALAQKRGDGDRGNYMTFADIYQFMSECFAYDRVKRAEGEELPTKTVADRLYKMVQEIYEAREELGFFVRKRITNPVTYEIVMLDISDKGDEMWPDSEGIPEDDDRCDEFEFLLPSQK